MIIALHPGNTSIASRNSCELCAVINFLETEAAQAPVSPFAFGAHRVMLVTALAHPRCDTKGNSNSLEIDHR
jgi:hypothetical protein